MDSRSQVPEREKGMGLVTRRYPKTATILVDTRENLPYLFPKEIKWWDGYRTHLVKLEPKERPLSAGDYQLYGFEEKASVERKANIRELWTNLFTKDRPRFLSALWRFCKQVKFPYLMVGASAVGMLTPTELVPKAGKVTDELLILSREMGFNLILGGPCATLDQRKKHGELVARLLLGACWGDTSLKEKK